MSLGITTEQPLSHYRPEGKTAVMSTQKGGGAGNAKVQSVTPFLAQKIYCV
jgi:hypothetical protein